MLGDLGGLGLPFGGGEPDDAASLLGQLGAGEADRPSRRRPDSAADPTCPLAYAPPVQTLIDELGRLPGIGPKSAQRIAFHLLKLPVEDAERLARAITEAEAEGAVLRALLQPRRRRAVRHLPRRPARRRGAVRRGGGPRHRRRREDR